MANNIYNTKSLAEEMKSSAYIWVGKTTTPDEYITLINFNNNLHKIIFNTTVDTLNLFYLEETKLCDDQVQDMLRLAVPELANKDNVSTTVVKSFKNVTITEDLNTELQSNHIAVLPEGMVVDKLNFEGDDVSSYSYTSLASKDKLGLSAFHMPKGYENYDDEVLKVAVDTSKYKSYVPEANAHLVFQAFLNSHVVALCLTGFAGCGKSLLPLIEAEHEGIPVGVEQWSKETMKADVISEIIPVLDTPVDKPVEAESYVSSTLSGNGAQFRLKLNNFVKFFEHGGIYVINEFNYAIIQAFMNAVLDDNAQIVLADGRVIKRHPNFKLVLTANYINYPGTVRQNASLKNRLMCYDMGEISQEEMVSRVMNGKLGYKSNPTFLHKLVEVMYNLADIYQGKGWDDIDLTLRSIETFLDTMINGGLPLELAFKCAFSDVLFISTFDNPRYDKEELDNITKGLIAELKEVHDTSLTGETKVGSMSGGIDLSSLDSIPEDGAVFNE